MHTNMLTENAHHGPDLDDREMGSKCFDSITHYYLKSILWIMKRHSMVLYTLSDPILCIKKTPQANSMSSVAALNNSVR